MFAYYLKLGWLSIRRNPLLSLLMVAAIAVGIGACMTIVTVNYAMSANPIPHKSDQLYYVQLDSWDSNSPGDDGFEPPDQVTYTDAMALMKGGQGIPPGRDEPFRPGARAPGHRRTAVCRERAQYLC